MILFHWRTVAAGLMAAQLFAQQTGRLRGVVTAPDTLPVPLAKVQARDAGSGAVFNATADNKGEYAFPALAAGTYDISVTSIRYLARYEQKSVRVDAAKSRDLDIHLGYVVMGGTPGEGHEAALSSLRRVPPAGPTPRMADGKPDLSGVWTWPITIDAGNPDFLPAAKPTGDLTLATYCLPHAVVWFYTFTKFVQTPKLMVVLYEDEDPNFRQIYLDGRKHPTDKDPTWYGHSVGRWEGDTLVVDRVGFNGKGWLDGDGHRFSEQLHLVERYRRPDLGHLEVEITMEDPVVLKGSWTIKRLQILAPEEDVMEYACTENNVDPAHMRK